MHAIGTKEAKRIERGNFYKVFNLANYVIVKYSKFYWFVKHSKPITVLNYLTMGRLGITT